MKFTTRTTYNGTLDDLDGAEIEFAYPPLEQNDPLVHRVGDTAIVAYLSHDDDPGNPMTNGDCQGHIYTKESRYASDRTITDNDGELLSALGLNSYGVDVQKVFQVPEPVKNWRGDMSTSTCLWDMAARTMYYRITDGDADLKQKWIDNQGTEDLWRDLFDENGVFWEEVGEIAHSLYPSFWQAIAGPFVVPISYHAERGGCMISPTTWDGDPDDLPDGVWVADAGAEENIRAGVREGYAGPLHAELHEGAINYAKGVCSEYASWCEGDAWGCVVETFKQTSEGCWEAVAEDTCWGYLGIDYAGQTLRDEYFDPAVEALDAGVTQ